MKTTIPLVAICIALCINLHGQTLETSFHSPLTLRAAFITALTIQSDNKLLISGDIAFYGSERVGNLIRTNEDGTLDNSFSFGKGNQLLIMALELLPDGKIAVHARSYSSYNNAYKPGNYLLILNNDGSVDKELSIANEAEGLAVQSDGKILIGGPTLARYHSDLTPDTEFNNEVSINSTVTAVSVSGDDIFIAGPFSSVNGETHYDIARLDMDGNVDNAFDTGTGTEDYIGKLVIQPDGKILLGRCYINYFNGQVFKGMIRLNQDGTVDADFQPAPLNGSVTASVVTGQGIYVASFFSYKGEYNVWLFRIDLESGKLDPTFPPIALDMSTYDMQIAILNNTILVNNTQGSGNVFGLSKINLSGNFIDSFKPEISRFGTIRHGDLSGNKLLIAGDFLRIDGIESYGVARIDVNGIVDESFRMKTNKGAVIQLKVIDNDNALVSTGKNFFKLDAHGDEKPEFSWTQFKSLYNVNKFHLLDDDKIMAADPNLIFRLQANGMEDKTFDPGELCCTVSSVFDYDMQGAKVIYGSEFSELGGVSVNRIARLKENGSVDQSFNPGEGPNANVALVKVLKNRDIIVGGFFTEFDGETTKNGLVKLSPEGTLDRTFNENQSNAPYPSGGIFFNPQVEEFGSQIIFRGNNSLYVMNIDGTVNPEFYIPAETGAITDIIAIDSVQNDGGRMKTATGTLFTFGNFTLSNANTVSLLKLSVGRQQSPNIVNSVQEDYGSLSVVLYPQPVTTQLKLKTTEAGPFEIVIVDALGNTVHQSWLEKKGKEDLELRVDQISSGVYFLKIASSSGRKRVLKFVKVN